MPVPDRDDVEVLAVSVRDSQSLSPLGPVRNSELFSNYWLHNRLPLEPDWHELLPEAEAALGALCTLWNRQRSRVEKYGKEAPLEEKFIQPVLEALGWKFFYQAHVQGRKPDYALFTSEEAYDQALTLGYTSPEFWRDVAVVADAKAWHVSLDKPHRVEGRKEYPPEQVEWYLDRTGVAWGILTNGRSWRLVPRVIPTGKSRFQTYLEVDLPAVIDAITARDQGDIQGQHLREFLYFYLLFSPSAFVSRNERTPLIERARLGSSEYAIGVSEDLKDRVFEALKLTIRGFLRRKDNRLSCENDLERCRENSLIFLYRLLFVMYAEDRGLLPYRINQTYTQNRSLARLRDDVASALDRRGAEIFSEDSTALWQELATLCDLVDAGHARYGVPAYDGGLFSAEQHPFLLEKAIGDRYVAQIIDKLSRTIDPHNRKAGSFRVDYRDLAIRQLGAVYEGLLEMRPRYATQPLAVIRSTKPGSVVERFHHLSKPVPQGFRDTGERVTPGDVYLETDKGERRATGSYYTPDHIVDYIVQSTLGPVCGRIQQEIQSEIRRLEEQPATAREDEHRGLLRPLDAVPGKFEDRILGLKILDPAMGSGHFLVRACQYLAEEIATSPFSSDAAAEERDEEQATLTFWKRRVAEHCLFGVDLNPLAVELAKLALWLETVSKNRPLAFLDHHLRRGNSLVGAKLSRLDRLPGAPSLLAGLLTGEFDQRKAGMLAPLHELRSLESADALAVKAKGKLLRQYEARANSFVALGDVWCGEFFREEGESALSAPEYGELVHNLGHPKKLKQLLHQRADLLARLSKTVAPFHWELEFPDAFSDVAPGAAEGFDAVIGNPPYDVLAAKELETDIAPLKSFLSDQPEYRASFVGKNNLYKLFVCKAVDLLRDGGYLGFIVPMPLLGDEQAIGVRSLLLSSGTFVEIHAFPQKDDPRKRVFPEAKLSTVVFVMTKTSNPEVRGRRFTATRHPGGEFVRDAPSLAIAAEEIAKYDPDNKTIVSCSQEDWDLAVRLMSQQHFCRLGERYISFQGEVNETTDGAKGVISRSPHDGPEILRGSNICLYAVREASQGESLFLKRDAYLGNRAPGSKAWHSQERRIGFQRSAPQNNFRRLIAAPLEKDEFCFDTVSYIPESTAKLPLTFALALLNSQLLDWYFRLGSSNSKVNEYQLNNLPCPLFSAHSVQGESGILAQIRSASVLQNWKAVSSLIEQAKLAGPPFSRTLLTVLLELIDAICCVEANRGEISRAARARLDPAAQPIQDVIDHTLFAMAGFSQTEVNGILERMKGLM